MKQQLEVFYDNQCSFCLKCKRFFERISRRRLSWQPVASAGQCGLSHRECAEQLHAVDLHGNVYRGFFAIRKMLTATWLFFTVPLLYLPGIPWAGQRVYLFIAKRRHHI